MDPRLVQSADDRAAREELQQSVAGALPLACGQRDLRAVPRSDDEWLAHRPAVSGIVGARTALRCFAVVRRWRPRAHGPPRLTTAWARMVRPCAPKRAQAPPNANQAPPDDRVGPNGPALCLQTGPGAPTRTKRPRTTAWAR